MIRKKDDPRAAVSLSLSLSLQRFILTIILHPFGNFFYKNSFPYLF